jgi:hypothetical protein
MDHAVLVDIEVRTGQEMLTALEGLGKHLTVALWATFPEYYDPRLVVAAPWLDREQGGPIHAIVESMHDTGIPYHRHPMIAPMAMSDPFIVELRKSYAGRPLDGLRLRGPVANRHVEDGYVYNIE